jgi:flavin reductase (DIM6/NTAB) family NADH-FMN oxidoreductase RutF
LATETLETAPMIREFPANIECSVIQTMERSVHTVFIGEIAGVYYSEECLTEGVPDIAKVDPIVWGPVNGPSKHWSRYWKMGESLGRAWHVGKALKR